jgi:hypothetical protein
MNDKAISRMLGYLSTDYESSFMANDFKAVILKQLGQPFPYREFSNLISEMTEKKKRDLLILLNLKLKVPANKPFPDIGLLQLVRTRMNKTEQKFKVIQGIMISIIDIFGEEIGKLSDQEYLAAEEEKKKDYGPWHYYWSLRLFPLISQAVEDRRAVLETELADPPKREKEIISNVIPINVNKKNKENSLVTRERELRQEAQRETETLKKQVRTQAKSLQRLMQENNRFLDEQTEREQRFSETQEAFENQCKKTVVLEREKNELAVLNKKQMKSISLLEERESSLRVQFEKEKALLQEVIHRDESVSELASRFIMALNKEVDSYFERLRNSNTSREQQGALRKQICGSLQLIDSLELNYFKPEAVPVIHSYNEEPQAAMQLEEIPKATNEYQDPQEKRFLGTFYRKDHGGYIVLENNEVFNITESLVNSIGLEHEAEVECEPQLRQDNSLQYNIRLLLQGDDTYAPINQYMGYVEFGDHFTYYCVDINNSNNRYPLHEKDFDIQQPRDGDPCLFNVAAVNGEYARLSRLYKRSTDGEAGREQLLKGNSLNSKPKNYKSAPEAFLKGCKIVIVGGLAKWFESVVKETGAELIHENGDRPERVHPELRKANAMFMLLTATSHRATWSCIDIAKENHVPHFTIQGSKSNLRTLLWENRENICRNMVAH